MTEPNVRRSLWGRLYHGETDYDFVGKLNRWLLISGVIIVIGFVSLSVRGLNLGIDFEGGVVWEVPQGDLSVADAEAAVTDLGVEGVSVQTLTSEGATKLRVESEALPLEDANEVTATLAELTGSSPDDVSFTSVGPSWGREISSKALRALVFFLIALTLYITFRFELKMAIPTIAALLHDILITISVYSLTGFEVTPATVVALLTILGFSIYDGIVVFDKVDENTPLVGVSHGLTYSGMVNLSLNQVLMRSLNTSITALLPVASLLVLGGFILGASTLEEFALALLVGLFAGAYSSIFIASPLLAVLKEREGRYRDVRERIASRAQAPAPALSAPPAAVVEGEAGEAIDVAATPATTVLGGGSLPRPRKKTKKTKKS
ncbi:MAG: protein translocase subunit SecF [Acidimicrobiia bacterium]|nr:protein translocase subunit SecF [Acidimicrobiia bacterium]